MLVCLCKYCFGIKIVPIDKSAKYIDNTSNTHIRKTISKVYKKPPIKKNKKRNKWFILRVFGCSSG